MATGVQCRAGSEDELSARMGSLIADTVARLRVCREAALPVPLDLLDDAMECLERVTDAALLRARRDEFIRRAALLVTEKSVFRKAAVLADEAKAMSRTWHLTKSHLPDGVPSTVRACLHAAAHQAELPFSQRQFYRVLCASDD